MIFPGSREQEWWGGQNLTPFCLRQGLGKGVVLGSRAESGEQAPAPGVPTAWPLWTAQTHGPCFLLVLRLVGIGPPNSDKVQTAEPAAHCSGGFPPKAPFRPSPPLSPLSNSLAFVGAVSSLEISSQN